MKYFLIGVLIMPLFITKTPAGEMTIQGTGSVQAAPEFVIMQVTVSTTNGKASEALKENNEKIKRALQVIQEYQQPVDGVERPYKVEVKTSDINLSPKYEYRGDNRDSCFVGYVAENSLEVKLIGSPEYFAVAGHLLDNIVEVGVNNIRGIYQGVKNQSEKQDEARKLAMQDAVRKAKLYSEAVNGTNLTIKAVAEHDDHGYGNARMMGGPQVASGGAPIVSGDKTISVNVSVTFLMDGGNIE